ncbi:MAG: hypothetical protein JWO86_7692 [Myxococcaceae bacterium]|nr:hypothetical protein [Myxococcaceae bacterium]
MACALAVFPGALEAGPDDVAGSERNRAPAPDFRYVGLEPIAVPRLGVAATAFGLGAGVTLAMSGLDTRQALIAGLLASVLSAFALRGAGAPATASGSVRMAIVPWGVLVHIDETPRILRWAAVRTVEVATSRAHHLLAGAALSSRVAIATDRDRFVGEAVGAVSLERLVAHLESYANEQSAPIALDLDGSAEGRESIEAIEPGCEMLLGAARDWLQTADAVGQLGLVPAGYRRTSALAPTARAVEVLGRILRDRTPRPRDPRAFAAVVAAELHAQELVPALVALAQCPHPMVAAVARQAARRLGAPRSKTGTLEELSPFLFEADRIGLEAWGAG